MGRRELKRLSQARSLYSPRCLAAGSKAAARRAGIQAAAVATTATPRAAITNRHERH